MSFHFNFQQCLLKKIKMSWGQIVHPLHETEKLVVRNVSFYRMDGVYCELVDMIKSKLATLLQKRNYLNLCCTLYLVHWTVAIGTTEHVENSFCVIIIIIKQYSSDARLGGHLFGYIQLDARIKLMIHLFTLAIMQIPWNELHYYLWPINGRILFSEHSTIRTPRWLIC